MEELVLALFVLKNQYQSQRSARNIAEPEFKPFNLAALRLPKDADTTRGATPNRRRALAVPAAC